MPVVNELHVIKFNTPHPQYKGDFGILKDENNEADKEDDDEKGGKQ
jgi:hypothetical protein